MTIAEFHASTRVLTRKQKRAHALSAKYFEYRKKAWVFGGPCKAGHP